MVEDKEDVYDLSELAGVMEDRSRLIEESLSREVELVDRAMERQAERTIWWEELITRTRQENLGAQLSSYKSIGGSLAALVGASIRDQAKIMIPFEIAEATRDFARFLSSGDPSALAASLKHGLAAKRYAEAAKSGGGSGGGGGAGAGGGGGGGGGGTPGGQGPGESGEDYERRARVIVNVGRLVGLVDTYEFARELIEAINENLSDDVVLEVQS